MVIRSIMCVCVCVRTCVHVHVWHCLGWWYLNADVQTIDNLWRLPLLTKLQLCNNVIEKVEGLDTLVHLEWLGEELDNSNR